MARLITNNLILTGFSGRIGDFVIRQTERGPVLCKRPVHGPYKPNPQQKRHNEKFARAAAYASAINKDPLLREAWAANLPKGKSVYQSALAAYMKRSDTDK